jgi:hypothetical protein
VGERRNRAACSNCGISNDLQATKGCRSARTRNRKFHAPLFLIVVRLLSHCFPPLAHCSLLRRTRSPGRTFFQ